MYVSMFEMTWPEWSFVESYLSLKKCKYNETKQHSYPEIEIHKLFY